MKEDILNISYSKLNNNSTLIVSRVINENKLLILNEVHNDIADFIMTILLRKETPPYLSLAEVVDRIIMCYSIEEVAIISGKLRKYVLTNAASKLTIAYLENGSLLRNAKKYD